MNRFLRNNGLIGADGQEKLARAHVLIVGIGGVGGYVFEMLTRAGVGNLTVMDGDKLEESNLNRQILALESTIGRYKTEVAKSRALEINPLIRVIGLNARFSMMNAEEIFSTSYDYCVDAIDSVTDKTDLILAAYRKNVPCISALGAGNRLDCDFAVMDVYKTKDDALAKVMRKKLRERGVEKLKTVCAKSPTSVSLRPTASISYCPAAMGCKIAEEVIKDLLCR